MESRIGENQYGAKVPTEYAALQNMKQRHNVEVVHYNYEDNKESKMKKRIKMNDNEFEMFRKKVDGLVSEGFGKYEAVEKVAEDLGISYTYGAYSTRLLKQRKSEEERAEHGLRVAECPSCKKQVVMQNGAKFCPMCGGRIENPQERNIRVANEVLHYLTSTNSPEELQGGMAEIIVELRKAYMVAE